MKISQREWKDALQIVADIIQLETIEAVQEEMSQSSQLMEIPINIVYD